MTVHFCTSWYAAGQAQRKRSSYAPLMRLDITNQSLTGVWAEIRSQVLSGKHLGRVGKDAGLAEAVATQAGTMGVSDGMMATVVQALMGALHLGARDDGYSKDGGGYDEDRYHE
jgi:hypothetical protein